MLPILHVAFRERARKRAIFCVLAHMVDKLRPILKYPVAVASILALEKSHAVVHHVESVRKDVAVILPAEVEHGEGLTARERLMIS